MEPKDNIIWPSFKRQFNTAVSGDNTVRKAVPYLDRYQQEQLERQQERQKRWEKQIHKRAVQKEFEERRLQKTYASLVEDNNAKSSEIEGSVDYERIYDYAVNELGMMYPEKGQTVTYKRNPGSYVKQGEEIPSN